jgi:hypothetical protein
MADAPSTAMKLAAVLGFLVLSACAGPRTSATSPRNAQLDQADYGEKVVAEAASCWLGGLWADAAGEEGDLRQAGIDKRCQALFDEVGPAPHETYASLRAVDERVVRRLEETLGARGGHAYTPLLRSIAEASREGIRARRAADQVKADYGNGSDASARHEAKEAAAAPLRESRALGALLGYQGPAQEDARTVGLLLALDRMEIARGLPKHLKVYAVEGALRDVFGVEPPQLSTDAAAPIPTGTWRTYLERAAAAAGHPVPDTQRDLFDRETSAWTGVLAGLADRIGRTSPSEALAGITKRVGKRLEDERVGAVNAAAARNARR